MDLFRNAKVVRLRSHHDKYLLAKMDEESVTQDQERSSKNALWTVDFVPNSKSIIYLKSCYNKHLTASDRPFLLGMTGRKVVQTLPQRLDSSLEWEPIGEGTRVKLKTRYGNFLRANGGLPPWRNSVTHDTPHMTATHDWILWDVEIVEIHAQVPQPVQNESSGMAMEELHAASDYYNNASPEVKQLAHNFFDSMDTNQDGQVSIDEFIEFFKQFDNSMDRNFFAALDSNGKSSLQFREVLMMHYILKTRKNCGNLAHIPQPDAQNECPRAQYQKLEESLKAQVPQPHDAQNECPTERVPEPDAKKELMNKRTSAFQALLAAIEVTFKVTSVVIDLMM